MVNRIKKDYGLNKAIAEIIRAITAMPTVTLYESVGLDWLINTFMNEEDADIVDFCGTIRILKEKLEEKRG